MGNGNPLTSRRPVPEFNRKPPFRDARLFIVATEGEITEPHYFSMFNQSNGMFFNQRVKRIDVLPTKNGESSPNHVLNRILEYKEKNDISHNDQCWLVLDVDKWEKNGKLNKVIRDASKQSIRLAISNPKFEVWLLCHHLNSLPHIDDLEATLTKTIGKKKKEFNLAPYISGIHEAIKVAKNHDTNGSKGYPNAPGTTVYKLLLEILPERGD